MSPNLLCTLWWWVPTRMLSAIFIGASEHGVSTQHATEQNSECANIEVECVIGLTLPAEAALWSLKPDHRRSWLRFRHLSLPPSSERQRIITRSCIYFFFFKWLPLWMSSHMLLVHSASSHGEDNCLKLHCDTVNGTFHLGFVFVSLPEETEMNILLVVTMEQGNLFILCCWECFSSSITCMHL